MFEETSEDLKKLIVYCRSVSIKPWSWRKQTETTVSEMFSFGEPTAIKHCDRSQRGECTVCNVTFASASSKVVFLHVPKCTCTECVLNQSLGF